jgi:hypothetical protein
MNATDIAPRSWSPARASVSAQKSNASIYNKSTVFAALVRLLCLSAVRVHMDPMQ